MFEAGALSLDRLEPRFAVCASNALADGQFRKLAIIFEGQAEECLLIRHAGRVHAYINRCVHMPRRLDGEAPQIFDPTGRFLRCTMHGIVFEPSTGASVSAICEGERLRAIEVYEADGEIGIADFRVHPF